MSKYNIISKSLRGNNSNKTCTITYQVKGHGASEFKVDLCYLELKDGPRYVYLEGNVGEYIETPEDKDEFLKELSLYQKGGAYRKTHPIIKTKSTELKEKKSKLEQDLRDLDSAIRKAEEQERKDKYEVYTADIDYKTLKVFIDDLVNVLDNDRYYIKPIMHIWDGYKLEVWDKQLDKPVQMGILKEDDVIFRDLKDYEIKM